MKANKSVKIVAMGKYLPKKVLSADIEKKHGIPLGWSERYSGVNSRHHVTFESGGYMGARAIEKALEKASISLKDIDLIISASATFDYPLPNQASIIKQELNDGLALDIGTIDIDTTCLSFVSGFDLASKLLDGKQYKNIVLVSSEISSKGLDESNWETLTLFGDAAVAAVLQFDETCDAEFIKGGIKTYSIGATYTMIEGGGNVCPVKEFSYDSKLHTFQMSGKKLLKLAKQKIPLFMDWFFEDLPYSLTDIEVIIPHQASKMGLLVFTQLYPFKPDQIRGNLSTNGNCIAASIPMVLHDEIEAKRIQRGQLVLLTGTSAGFSIGGVLIKY